MNIFLLDADPGANARAHCDKHITKMPSESVQMLTSAAISYGMPQAPRRLPDGSLGIWKATHIAHPCTRWASADINNFAYLLNLLNKLCQEYSRRYSRRHACADVYYFYSEYLPFNGAIDKPTSFVLAMPIEAIESALACTAKQAEAYKKHCSLEQAVACYREYYMGYKAGICEWPM